MPILNSFDFYNHAPVSPGTNLAAAAVSTTAAGTVIPVAAGAGTGATVTIPTGATPNDTRGQFNVVTAGSPAAGVIATVFFSNAYSQLPGAFLVTALDTTASPVAPVKVSASSATATGFSVVTDATLTTAHTILINYEVVA